MPLSQAPGNSIGANKMPPNQTSHADRSTEGMVDYDRNSIQQRRFLTVGQPWVRDVVPRIGVVAPEFRIVDYGCGPGRSTLETVRPAVAAYRGLSATGPIAVTHADLPGNDWNALFALVHSPDGYANGDPNIRSEASVGSFYDAMAAPASVSLGTCFTAIHWPSRPVRLAAPGTMLHTELPDAARAEVAALAEADWLAFLRHRAREIHAGGYLVVNGLGVVADPSRPNGLAATSQGLFRATQTVAESLADEGSLDRDVLDHFVFPGLFRTVDELRRPLEQEPDLRAAFDIVDATVQPSPVNPKDAFADDRSDPDRYSERYVGYLRGFGDSTLRSQLFRPSVKDERDIEPLICEFYRRFGQLYRETPDAYVAETWISTLVLRRR
jgi:SAM dependent carboxyl methyltransferase